MLKQNTIQAFRAAIKELDNPLDVAEYARDLIGEDSAPCFADLAGGMLNLPLGKLSQENSEHLGKLEEKLEREWWRNTGDALLAELLGEPGKVAA